LLVCPLLDKIDPRWYYPARDKRTMSSLVILFSGVLSALRIKDSVPHSG
jgi:hypothetical protein